MKRNLIFTGQWLVTALLLAIGLSAYGCADTASVSEDVAAPLASLSVTPGGLQPAFFANTTNYAVNTPTYEPSVTVTAVPKDNTAIVRIDGFVTSQRSVTLDGPGSTKTILIVVETLNGLETTYTVTVTRLLSSDNNLRDLRVEVGTAAQALNPPFAANILEYAVNAQNDVTSPVTVIAKKSDKDATMVIRSPTNSVTVGPGVNPGQLPVTLGGPGTGTPVSIEVTAPNGNKQTYRITVNRILGIQTLLELKVRDPDTSTLLSLTPGFSPDIERYSVNVPTNTRRVTVSATKSDLNAEMLIGSVIVPAGIASAEETFPLNGAGGPPTEPSITVTAQNGVDQKTYTITVNRAASNDKYLSALSLTAITGPLNLVPSFDRNHLDYTVEVPVGIIAVTVTATKSDPNAVLSGSVPDPGTGAATGQATIVFILLPPPQVLITVTAPDGSFETYRVTVNQVLGPPPSP